jgi:alkyl hydroperoxide reductase subunit AhpF
MPILSASDAARVREMLASLPNPVRLVFFTQTLNCETCEPAKQILGELAELSGQITVEEHNFLLERELAATYGIDRVPAIAVVGAQDYGIRFLGIPSGYEFMSLLDAIQIVSAGDSGLNEGSRALLAGLESPLALQVFVTPT